VTFRPVRARFFFDAKTPKPEKTQTRVFGSRELAD